MNKQQSSQYRPNLAASQAADNTPNILTIIVASLIASAWMFVLFLITNQLANTQACGGLGGFFCATFLLPPLMLGAFAMSVFSVGIFLRKRGVSKGSRIALLGTLLYIPIFVLAPFKENVFLSIVIVLIINLLSFYIVSRFTYSSVIQKTPPIVQTMVLVALIIASLVAAFLQDDRQRKQQFVDTINASNVPIYLPDIDSIFAPYSLDGNKTTENRHYLDNDYSEGYRVSFHGGKDYSLYRVYPNTSEENNTQDVNCEDLYVQANQFVVDDLSCQLLDERVDGAPVYEYSTGKYLLAEEEVLIIVEADLNKEESVYALFNDLTKVNGEAALEILHKGAPGSY